MDFNVTESRVVENSFDTFFRKYDIGRLLRCSNVTKSRGFSSLVLFKFIFGLVFTGKNLYRSLLCDNSEHLPSKDPVYRFLASSRHNWRAFLLRLASVVIHQTVSGLTSKKRPKILILDDSLYDRGRSKCVELLSRVHDHTTGRYVFGFRMLTLGWSDGSTFLPLAFSLLSSRDKKHRQRDIDPAIDKRTNGYKRRRESLKKATEVLFDLLEQSKAHDVQAAYLLFDSWFAFPAVIRRVLEHRLHVVCMLKDTPRIRYSYKGFEMNLKQIYKDVRKTAGRARILASTLVEIGQDAQGRPVPAKIVFVRDRNGSKKWLALLTTDIHLSDEEVIRLYKKRWDIETFFKITKSYLKLAKEFQGRSYDALVAHTTIVFSRYIMLATTKRTNEDPRTLGTLFFAQCDEIQDVKFSEAIALLLNMLKESFGETNVLTSEQLNEVIEAFFSKISAFFNRFQLLKTYGHKNHFVNSTT